MENVIVLLGGHRQHIVIKIEAKIKKEGAQGGEKFHLYAMMAINHLMDGIKMQPECITPTL